MVKVLFLLVAGALSAQSVTISQAKLDELTGILQTYMQATETLKTTLDNSQKTIKSLQESLTNSQTQIDALQSGFDQYKQTVEGELLPKAKALESDVFWLKIGLGAAGVVGLVAIVAVIFKP